MAQQHNITLSNLHTRVNLHWYQMLGPGYIENRFTLPIRKLLVRNRLTLKLLNKINSYLASRFLQLNKDVKSYENAIKRLSNSVDTGYELNSDYGYAGDVFIHEMTTAGKYKKQIDEGFNGPSESKKLYEHIINTSVKLLTETGAPSYFNFGVSYAYTDAILAGRFPAVKFYGIERTDAAKIYNDRFYADINNLTIFGGDIFELFSKRRFDGGVFFHSRTLLLLPQEFIRKLYVSARNAGFKYIFGAEQYGISRQTEASYEFSFEPQDSVVYRDFMYIHNYPNLLKECGFELVKIESLKTDHPHQDYRVLSFLARAV